jgi:hypothetical protein
MGELGAPPTPLTNAAKGPTSVDVQILTATPAERVGTIRMWIDSNINKVVSELFKKEL